MYKVTICSLLYGNNTDTTQYSGEGSTVQAALNRARKSMYEVYTAGVISFDYDVYKADKETGEWIYIQTLGESIQNKK